MQQYRPNGRSRNLAPAQPAPPDDSPTFFRPTRRPATPLLTVFDDASEKGESVRVRKEQFIIGRAEGDLVIPHDGQMSGRHAELRRTFANEKYRWHLIDLKSTNGTYVRVGQAILQDGQEFIIGRTRFRFEKAESRNGSPGKLQNPAHQATCTWQNGANQILAPSITELTPEGLGRRVLITRNEFWLGKDTNYCQHVLNEDPFVSARHARMTQEPDGRWLIENNKSVNGVWLRIEQISIKGTCRFLLGEQLFMLRIPS
jgi:pSer/pThr/pTyr-binding forkhead associated (FHA) protein